MIIADICHLPLYLSLSHLYGLPIDNIYMKYILASDPVKSGGSPSPVPVIDTGHWSAARRDDETESAARVPTDNYHRYFGAASPGPGLLRALVM